MQMADTATVYAGVPSIAGQVVFRFEIEETQENGATLVLNFPEGFALQCNGAFFRPISLPRERGPATCQGDARENKVTITVGERMAQGKYAFAALGTPPSKMAQAENIFSLRVLNDQGTVADAAMGIPGIQIQYGVKASALPLSWNMAEAGKISTVGMGFQLIEDLPDFNPPRISQILILFPPDVVQSVQRRSHVNVMNEQLPLRSQPADWLDFMEDDRLRIFLDPNTTAARMKTGRYSFTFPALIPNRMPPFNVWQMTICIEMFDEHGRETGCDHPTDKAAVVTFPLAGFNLGEVHPDSGGRAFTSFASGARLGPACVFVALALVGLRVPAE